MKSHLVAAIVTAATVIFAVGCSSTSTSMGASPSPSSSSSVPSLGSAENDQLCRSLRSYKDRGLTPELQESCVRQLGAENCRKCLSAP